MTLTVTQETCETCQGSMKMNQNANHRKVVREGEDGSRPVAKPDEKRTKRLPKGEQPLAEDESQRGGIDGAVGGGQSGQGGG